MATEKKKPSSKKTPATKATTAKKTTPKGNAKASPTKLASAKAKPKATKLSAGQQATRRPDPNDTPHKMMIVNITDDLMDLVRTLDNYAVNLRALDRQRHNGVGMKRLGFIEAALRCSKALRTFELGVCA